MGRAVNLKIEDWVLEDKNKILLMGNPNVGKSVIFSHLTGKDAISSNFSGTTVTYTFGKIKIGDKDYTLIDVPGTYSIKSTNDAEKVAQIFLESGALAIICVLDATCLQRNINLALELKNYNIPMVISLNLLDVAKRKGIRINSKILEKELGAPVVETVAVKGQGVFEIKELLGKILDGRIIYFNKKVDKDIWEVSGEIAKKCVRYESSNLSFVDKLGDMFLKPFPGVILAFLVLLFSLSIIVGLGKVLSELILLPFIKNVLVPFFRWLILPYRLPKILNNILIGEYGIFSIGFEWVLGLILPYVTLFYVVFSFLEDCGFLPRLAVLFDGIMKKFGASGTSLIPLLMGYGCAVPAVLATRGLPSKKERIIVTCLVSFAVPCISQTGALVTLLSSYSVFMFLGLIVLAFLVLLLVGTIAGKIVAGHVEPMVLEIPNFLIPEKKAYFKKLKIRLKSFIFEAEGPMFLAIFLAAFLKETGLLEFIASLFDVVLSKFLGLPKEAVIFLILGIIRREMAVAPLISLNLTPLQVFVGAAVSLFYLPCLSVFGVITKEFNLKTAILIGLSTFVCAILIGGAINFIGHLIL